MKLQKLCYYAQGFTLALTGKPLFNERIEAWAYGPVVPELYSKYSDYVSNVIPYKNIDPTENFNEDELEILNETYHVYGDYSALKLSRLSHSEPTWINHYHINSNDHKEEIPQEEMEIFFKTLVEYE